MTYLKTDKTMEVEHQEIEKRWGIQISGQTQTQEV